MKKNYERGYKQGQKDMLKSILGVMILTGTLMLIFAKVFMII